MPYVTTFIAPEQASFFEDAPLKILKDGNIKTNGHTILAAGRAVDVFSGSPIPKAILDEIRTTCRLDALCQNSATRHKKLFMADMDATMVEEETLDELAAHAGIKDKIAAITTRAMNGELDFEAALKERVGLLKGLPVKTLATTAANMHFTRGGETLLKTLKANGMYCVLVSGGFTYFTNHVGVHLGFDENHGNTLDIAGDALAGTVGLPILDKNFKKKCLLETAQKLGVDLSATIAIGDGANDLPMLEAAGLGIGFNSKKILREALPNHLLYNGLDALIYVLGLGENA